MRAGCDALPLSRLPRGSDGTRESSGSGASGCAATGIREEDRNTCHKELVQIHRSLKAAAAEARRAACRWDSQVRRCMLWEELKAGQFKAAADMLRVRPRPDLHGVFPRMRRRLDACVCKVVALWLRSLRFRVFRLVSCCCGMLSAIIILGETTIFIETWSMSLLSLLFRSDHGPWLTQVFCVVPLSYMAYTAYFSIFRLKIAGWYGIYGNGNTDAGSLVWCASLLARLSAPLCYHFLLLIRLPGTTFQAYMGKMNVVPVLGDSVNKVFPCVIAVLCLMNVMNVYERIMRCLTWGVVGFDLTAEVADGEGSQTLSTSGVADVGSSGGGEGSTGHVHGDPRVPSLVVEGQQLIERERRRRQADAGEASPERLAVPLAAPTSPCG